MKKEYYYIGITICCSGSTATMSKLLLSKIDVMCAAAFSFLAASFFLFAYALKSGILKKLKTMPFADIVRMLLIGFMGVFLYNVFLLYGTSILMAQQAFVVHYIWPALIILFSAVILHERLTVGKVCAVMFSFLGVVTATSNGNLQQFMDISPRGVLYCVLAAVSYSLYTVLNKRESYDKNLSVCMSFATAAVAAFVLIFVQHRFAVPSAGVTAWLTAYGLICDVLPYLLWALAMDMGNTAVLANLIYLTPVVSMLMTHFVLGEEITAYSIAGLAMILAGIVIQMLSRKIEIKTEKQE